MQDSQSSIPTCCWLYLCAETQEHGSDRQVFLNLSCTAGLVLLIHRYSDVFKAVNDFVQPNAVSAQDLELVSKEYYNHL